MSRSVGHLYICKHINKTGWNVLNIYRNLRDLVNCEISQTTYMFNCININTNTPTLGPGSSVGLATGYGLEGPVK